MKSIIVAAAFLSTTAAVASAQPVPGWEKGKFPYARENHAVCTSKARQLYGYEHRAASDGKLTRKEQATIDTLRRDLDRTCGKYRWKG